MRYRILLLSLAMLAACAGDPGGPPAEHPPQPRAARVDEMRVVKIAGDQAARVPPAGGSADLVAASTMPAWTSEPLVARIEVVPPAPSGGAAFSLAAAADSLYVPPGTLVHWRIDPDCGELFAQTTATDDSAYTANRWAPGTRAGTCTVEAGRLVGTEIVIDTTWTMQVLPGPSAALVADHESISMPLGDTVALSWHFEDVYGNHTEPCPYPVSVWPYNESVVQSLGYGDPRIVAVGRGTTTVRIYTAYGPGGECTVEGQHHDYVDVSVY
ncbi:MAG TPA: hypothetical protein VF158_04625 [Longimicrobiales bacterium]